MPKVRGQDATHWRRRVLDMKILAYIYLFDILLKITSPRLNGLTNLIFNLHAKDINLGILKDKAEHFFQATGKFKKFDIVYQGLSMEDM